jgi:alanine dehydrogenase
MHPESWAVPLEMPVKTRDQKKALRIGVPQEMSPGENRVALTPESVAVLVANGHEVFVQKGAGVASSFTDKAYADAGAFTVYALADVYTRADIIVKISPVTEEELELLRPHQTLISALNLGSMSAEQLRVLIRKNILSIGFEFLMGSDGGRPLVQMMSEIAGVTSIHIATELLSAHTGGRGLLLGGITGVPPAMVTIIGAGTVGYNAARTALGVGATVKVIDEDVNQLRALQRNLGISIHTAVSLQHYVREAVESSDVVIGAAFKPGHRAPLVVTEDMVANMREGSVIVDVAMDQGGCVETSRPTTHERPTFVSNGVIHYCVPNIASRVPASASVAVSNILGPLLLKAGDLGGMEALMKVNEGVKHGVYVYRRHLTKRSLSTIFGIDFMDINLLVASQI